MSFKTKTLKADVTLSEQLRGLRESRSLSIDDLGQRLQIQPNCIIFLESGAYEKLPASVYIKGFLRRYARCYRVPFDNLWQLYQKESQILQRVTQKTQATDKIIEPLKTFKPFCTPRILLSGLVGVAVISLLGYFGYQLKFLLRPPAIDWQSPTEDMITWDKNFLIQGIANSNAQLWLNGQVLPAEKDGHFATIIILSQGLNQIQLVAENPFGRKTEIVRNVILKQ